MSLYRGPFAAACGARVCLPTPAASETLAPAAFASGERSAVVSGAGDGLGPCRPTQLGGGAALSAGEAQGTVITPREFGGLPQCGVGDAPLPGGAPAGRSAWLWWHAPKPTIVVLGPDAAAARLS